MTVNVELFEDLDSVARDADGALDREARPTLFERLEWFRLLERHCKVPGKLVVLRGRGDGGATWLFLAVDGARATAYTAWYSLRFDAIGDKPSDVMTALAATLRHGGIARAEIAPLEDPEPLREGFRKAGWVTFLAPKTVNWRVETEGDSFEGYWARRPAKLRNTARRRASTAGLDIHILTHFEDAAWADYEAVYRASWKPEEGSFPFLRALAEQEGNAGTLRLGLAYKDGQPVAAQLWLVDNGEATIHKLAYAETAKSLSPGTILSMEMFRHVLDQDRVRSIDYGTGDEPYKADWMDERRPLWRLCAYNPRTLLGLFLALRAAASNLAARWRSR